LALLFPATSHAPANLDLFPLSIALDWYYLWFLPLLDRVSGQTLWSLFAVAGMLGLALPWLPPKPKVAAALVDLPNCNGCGRCHTDCPYTAITMAPRSDGSAYAQEAVVDAALCVHCGICMGACPTATPFRRRAAMHAGIELPLLSSEALKEQMVAATEGLAGAARVLVFGCQRGPCLTDLASSEVGGVILPCIGALPPSFIDFALSRGLVEGVLLTGCRVDACYDRTGVTITEQRMERTRDPGLREHVPRARVQMAFVGNAGDKALHQVLAEFRKALLLAGGHTHV
jgi:ferredoxin